MPLAETRVYKRVLEFAQRRALLVRGVLRNYIALRSIETYIIRDSARSRFRTSAQVPEGPAKSGDQWVWFNATNLRGKSRAWRIRGRKSKSFKGSLKLDWFQHPCKFVESGLLNRVWYFRSTRYGHVEWQGFSFSCRTLARAFSCCIDRYWIEIRSAGRQSLGIEIVINCHPEKLRGQELATALFFFSLFFSRKLIHCLVVFGRFSISPWRVLVWPLPVLNFYLLTR